MIAQLKITSGASFSDTECGEMIGKFQPLISIMFRRPRNGVYLVASSCELQRVHRKMYVCFSFRPAISDFEIVITALGPHSQEGLAEIGVKNFILDGRPHLSVWCRALSLLLSVGVPISSHSELSTAKCDGSSIIRSRFIKSEGF